MATNSLIEKLLCVYKSEKIVTMIKANELVDKKFCITIMFEADTKTLIKISLMNTTKEEESYTCILKPDSYAILRLEQDLLVEFEDFAEALSKMFEHCSQAGNAIKITTGENMQLGFFTKSQLRELTILNLTIEETNPKDIVLHFKRRILKITDAQSKQQAVNKHMQEELDDLKDQLDKNNNIIEMLKQKNKVLEETIDKANSDCYILKVTQKEKEEEILNAWKKCEYLKTENTEFQKTLTRILLDFGSMKLGVDHYMKKVNTLQVALDDSQKNSVSIIKYKCLLNMFSKAVADLMKSQLCLKKVSSLNELQKSDNKNLKDELAHCIDIINNMQKTLKSEKSTMSCFKKQNILIEALEKKLQVANKQ